MVFDRIILIYNVKRKNLIYLTIRLNKSEMLNLIKSLTLIFPIIMCVSLIVNTSSLYSNVVVNQFLLNRYPVIWKTCFFSIFHCNLLTFDLINACWNSTNACSFSYKPFNVKIYRVDLHYSNIFLRTLFMSLQHLFTLLLIIYSV